MSYIRTKMNIAGKRWITLTQKFVYKMMIFLIFLQFLYVLTKQILMWFSHSREEKPEFFMCESTTAHTNVRFFAWHLKSFKSVERKTQFIFCFLFSSKVLFSIFHISEEIHKYSIMSMKEFFVFFVSQQTSSTIYLFCYRRLRGRNLQMRKL